MSDVTSTDVLAALVRRWYLLLPGLALSVAGAFLAMSVPGVYATGVQVILVSPKNVTVQDPSLVSTQAGLIAMAGLVERTVNAGTEPEAPTSSEVPLEGRGVREGTQVTLPNAGGQWDYNFTAPVLTVQVVGHDPAEVAAQRAVVVARIDRTLHDIQAADGVSPSRMITSRVVPREPPVRFETGRPTRAGAATLVLGLLLVTVLTVTADRALLGRRRRAEMRPRHAVSA